MKRREFIDCAGADCTAFISVENYVRTGNANGWTKRHGLDFCRECSATENDGSARVDGGDGAGGGDGVPPGGSGSLP